MVSVRVSLLHRFSRVNFDHSVGESHSYELGIWREGDIVGEKLGVKFDFAQDFLSLDVNKPQHVVVAVRDDVSFERVNSEVHDFFIFLRLSEIYMFNFLDHCLFFDAVNSD